MINNDGAHVPGILKRTKCGKHNAPEGIPCFHIFPSMGKVEFQLAGICGNRIKKAGFNGKISPTSLSMKSPGGRSTRKQSNSIQKR